MIFAVESNSFLILFLSNQTYIPSFTVLNFIADNIVSYVIFLFHQTILFLGKLLDKFRLQVEYLMRT